MSFCLTRSEHTWLWPEEEGGFDGFLWNHSRAIGVGLPPLAQSVTCSICFVGFFFFFFK